MGHLSQDQDKTITIRAKQERDSVSDNNCWEEVLIACVACIPCTLMLHRKPFKVLYLRE